MEFFATCPKGFEKLLAEELASLKIPQVRALRGQVSFGGELADAYRACLWSRLASRVLLVLARVDAHTATASTRVSVASIGRATLPPAPPLPSTPTAPTPTSGTPSLWPCAPRTPSQTSSSTPAAPAP